MKPVLFLLMGYPGSGKSYFARQLAPKLGAVRLNSDAMRASLFEHPDQHHNEAGYAIVFGAIDYACREILQAGRSVIYDANGTHERFRRKNYAIAEECGALAITIWVKTPIEKAVQRAATRDESLDQIRLDEAMVRKHFALEEPTDGECVIMIDGTAPFVKQFESFARQLAAFEG